MRRSVVRTLSCAAVVVMLAASTLHTAALARELEGATLADTVKAGEKTLKLNGLGLRKKAMQRSTPSVSIRSIKIYSLPQRWAGAFLSGTSIRRNPEN